MKKQNKFVCPECVDDYAIQEFIKENANSKTCSYCGKGTDEDSEELIAADFPSVASFVRDAIEGSYEDPANGVAYESAEGGYQLPTMDSSDLLSEVGLDGSNYDFLQDLGDEFSDLEWVKKDPYGDWEDDALRYSWERFSEQVKHETRFVFFKLISSSSLYSDPEPYQILEDIGRIATKLDLFACIPLGATIIRARQHAASYSPCTAADLGSPPKEWASQSRMSPAGIPMFYGAENEATAFAEVYSTEQSKPHVTFATFSLLRSLALLDLTAIPTVPSFFDGEETHVRLALSFMHSFVESATVPVPHDESLHYRYVPTQVVAEYFRHVFRLPDDKKLDGILFKSSKNGGKCFTLFLDRNQCTDSATATDKSLVLSSFRKVTVDFTNGTYS